MEKITMREFALKGSKGFNDNRLVDDTIVKILHTFHNYASSTEKLKLGGGIDGVTRVDNTDLHKLWKYVNNPQKFGVIEPGHKPLSINLMVCGDVIFMEGLSCSMPPMKNSRWRNFFGKEFLSVTCTEIPGKGIGVWAATFMANDALVDYGKYPKFNIERYCNDVRYTDEFPRFVDAAEKFPGRVLRNGLYNAKGHHDIVLVWERAWEPDDLVEGVIGKYPLERGIPKHLIKDQVMFLIEGPDTLGELHRRLLFTAILNQRKTDYRKAVESGYQGSYRTFWEDDIKSPFAEARRMYISYSNGEDLCMADQRYQEYVPLLRAIYGPKKNRGTYSSSGCSYGHDSFHSSSW